MITHILSAAAMTMAFAASAVAQTAADQTGTGGGPSSTIYAPNTSAVGRTMPPAGAGGPRRDADRESRMERKNDKIDTGICIGCDK